ncbi:Stretch-activated cation channel MID1 [Trametes pubescens]|uniref:Stretch-activated cation channel MID1 n=1 Tax=Trametes pubescens TaxID=154538 RepID=A0A1M2V997_TRAPU|nr:Stretch-activated cation channel MID1 [Trametes pubescens]
MFLPIPLLAVIQSFLVLVDAQQPQQLVLERVLDISTANLPNPPAFRIPASTDPLFVTVALCAAHDNSTRFFLTNDSSISNPGASDVDSVNTVEIGIPAEGFGSWSTWFTDGGVLSVSKGSTVLEIQMLVSASNSTDMGFPLVGDTTSNQALVFSPPFDPPPIDSPTFPNYTLPSANLSFTPPASPPNYTLILAPTAQSNLTLLPRTACALRVAAPANAATLIPPFVAEGVWLRDSDGWRWQWLLNALSPLTNYTMFAIRTGELASSAPAYFVTKSATFNCPIVHSLSFCPSVAYATPLAPPAGVASAHTADTLPDGVADTLISIMANFTITLSTLACGRDVYSPLVTCAGCSDAYRRWLCAVSFPRCAETQSQTLTSQSSAQVPLPALQAVKSGATPRNPALPAFSSDYQALLPCLETCNAADRACPNFLGFKCPLPRFTAADSYGVGYIDNGDDGVIGHGSTGVAQDVYGNVWCNIG